MEQEQKGNVNSLETLGSLCGKISTKFNFRVDYSNYCYNLNKALSITVGQSGGNIIDPTKAPNICTIFMNRIISLT
jgi:hypothetical protein